MGCDVRLALRSPYIGQHRKSGDRKEIYLMIPAPAAY